MYTVEQVLSSLRMSALWTLCAPEGKVLASTDQGYSLKQLRDHARTLNGARFAV